jgi:DNA polymerase-1
MGEIYDAAFDIETNDLYKPNKLLSICATVIYPGGKTESFSCCDHPGYDGSIADGVALLLGAKGLIGHNIISFDSRHINLIAKVELDKAKMCDTLIATRLLWPDIRDADIAAAKIPTKYYGKHSLAAWGWRLDQHKGEFSDWGRWSPEMQAYCTLDVEATVALYRLVVAATADLT